MWRSFFRGQGVGAREVTSLNWEGACCLLSARAPGSLGFSGFRGVASGPRGSRSPPRPLVSRPPLGRRWKEILECGEVYPQSRRSLYDKTDEVGDKALILNMNSNTRHQGVLSHGQINGSTPRPRLGILQNYPTIKCTNNASRHTARLIHSLHPTRAQLEFLDSSCR